MATWFKASGWRWKPEIKPVEVIGETECFITMPNPTGKGKPWREAKRTDDYAYFPSWDDAHSFMLNQVGDRVRRIRTQLEQAKGTYGNVKGMKKPEPAT